MRRPDPLTPGDSMLPGRILAAINCSAVQQQRRLRKAACFFGVCDPASVEGSERDQTSCSRDLKLGQTHMCPSMR